MQVERKYHIISYIYDMFLRLLKMIDRYFQEIDGFLQGGESPSFSKKLPILTSSKVPHLHFLKSSFDHFLKAVELGIALVGGKLD